MQNKIPLALSNGRPIPYTVYAAVGAAVPGPSDPVLEVVRAALHLDDASTDWYIHNLVMALDAHPDIKASAGETLRLYRPWNRVPATPVILGGSLVPDETGVARCAWTPSAFPRTFRRRLVKGNGQNEGFLDGERVDVRISGGVLHVQWPEHSGLRGWLDVGRTTAWVAGSSVSIEAEPAGYPWEAASAVGRTTEGIHLLNRTGLLESFTTTLDPMEAAALLAAAICIGSGITPLP